METIRKRFASSAAFAALAAVSAAAVSALLLSVFFTGFAEAKLVCSQECGGACPNECFEKSVECRPDVSQACSKTTQGFKAMCKRQINMGCSPVLNVPWWQCNTAPPGYAKDSVKDGPCDCGFLGIGALFGGGVNKFHKDFPSEKCEAQPKCPAGFIQEKKAAPCSIEATDVKQCCEVPEEQPPGVTPIGKGGMQLPEKKLASISITPFGTKDDPFQGYSVNDEITLLALGYAGDGSEMQLENVEWNVVSGVGDFTEKSGNTAKFVGYAAGKTGIVAASQDAAGETWLELAMANVTRIFVTPTSLVLPAGSAAKFNALATDAQNKSVAITPKWSVENIQGLGTINASSGEFKAVGPGLVRVHASYANVSGNASVNITASQLARLEVRGPTKIYHRTQCYENYFAAGYNTKNEVMALNELAGIDWKVNVSAGSTGRAYVSQVSGVPSLAKLCTGQEGNVTLVASSANVSANLSIEIISFPSGYDEDNPPPLDKVFLDHPPNLTTRGVRAGKEIPFVLQGVDTLGNAYLFVQEVSWSVASLDGKGNGTIRKGYRDYYAFFTGTVKGSVRVEARTTASPTSQEVKNASTEFNVVESGAASIKIHPSQVELQELYGGNVEEGKSIQFSVEAFDQLGNWVSASVAWTVNVSETMALIDSNGLFAARSAGVVRVTAIALGAPGVNDSVTVKVIQRILDRVDLCLPPFNEPCPTQVPQGASYKCTLNGFKCHFSVERPVGAAISATAIAYEPGNKVAAGIGFGWSSENDSITSLEATPAPGVASFLARSVGRTKVFARASDKQGNATINVTPAVECTPGSVIYTPFSPPPLNPKQPFAFGLFEAYVVVNGSCRVSTYFECRPGSVTRLVPDPVVGLGDRVNVRTRRDTLFEKSVSFGPRFISFSDKKVAYYLYYLPEAEQSWPKVFGLSEVAQVYENPTTTPPGKAYVNATLLDVTTVAGVDKAKLKVEYVC